MRTTTIRHFILFLALGVLSIPLAMAQGALYEIPLAQQVEESSLIIEGKVIAQEGFWNQENANIFTLNTIEVYKVFKGQAVTRIEMITPGGQVGMNAEKVTPSLGLNVNDVGVFTLTPTNVILSNGKNNLMTAYSGPQGFYRYETFTNKVVNPFKVIEGVETNFYPMLTSHTRVPFVEVKQFKVPQISNVETRGSVNITNISPTTVTSGTGTVLTITGSGFGGTPQTVGFTNADDGGATYTFAASTQILSWSDTTITVEIPSEAGNGNVAIIDNPPTMVLALSGQNLSVDYAHINATADLGASGLWTDDTQHYNDNGNGGYTWQMFTDFDANTPANESFMRAFNTWRCTTDIYWEMGATTATDATALDGINIVRFDNGSELPVGVLGVCTSYFSGCLQPPPTDVEWIITELDITFDDGVTWEYGPALPSVSEYDFESVAVHELGHGHQLAHVIDSNAIMHYAIANGDSNRTLSSDDIDAGNALQTRSTGTSVCGAPVASEWDCTLSNAEFDLTGTIAIYPSPATEVLFIRNNSFISLYNLTIYDINGRIVKQQDLRESNELFSVDVSQLSDGVYFAKIATENGTLTKKIIIE